MNLLDEIRDSLIAYGIVGIGAIAGLVILTRPGIGRIWPIQRLRLGTWTGSAVLGHVLLSVFCGYLPVILVSGDHVAQFFPEAASPTRQMFVLLPLAMTFFLSLSFTLLMTLARTHVAAAGFSFGSWRRSLFLGLAGFLIVTPLVHAVYIACVSKFGQTENSILKIAKEGLREVEWMLVFIQTVVLAPIIEEWLFRGLLQGWLRRAPLIGHAVVVWIAISIGVLRGLPDFRFPAINFLLLAGAVAVPYSIILFWLYRPVMEKGARHFLDRGTRTDVESTAVAATLVDAAAAQEGQSDSPSPSLHPLATDLFAAEGEERKQRPWRDFGSSWFRWKLNIGRLSVLGSAIIWAMLHDNWPDPIPLFVMGLMLGWLAFRTQNIVPGIIIHVLFNLMAFIILFHQTANGNAEMVATRPSASPAIVNVAPGSWWPRLK